MINKSLYTNPSTKRCPAQGQSANSKKLNGHYLTKEGDNKYLRKGFIYHVQGKGTCGIESHNLADRQRVQRKYGRIAKIVAMQSELRIATDAIVPDLEDVAI